ncbi:MAG: multiheme c-type cytochrome [Candidatus Hydrothermarchaeales archaeon]
MNKRVLGVIAALVISAAVIIVMGSGVFRRPAATVEEIFHPVAVEEPEHTSPVFLPGTQPRDISQSIISYSTCAACHGGYADYSPYDTWKGSLMRHAARDPLFLALNAISNRDLEGVVEVGDYCLRCHTPTGWLEGRSEPVDGSALTSEDLGEGVSCDFCHRLVDPLSADGRLLSKPDVEVHANSQYVVSPEYVRRGPYNDTNAPHKTLYSEFHTKSELCGTCHDILNPVYDLTTPVETTYSEWKYSAFAREGIECQDCHMLPVEGYACYSSNVKLRDDIYKHEFVGGNAWMPDVLALMYDFDEETLAALKRTKALAIDMLQSAAALDLSASDGKLRVKVTNLAGHKLPTGYPEGRRMWLNVVFYDSQGNVILESGGYDIRTGELTYDEGIKVYEAKPGTKDVPGYSDGPSFHFALNNYVYKDNRIPPRGFTNAEYEAAMAYIRGAEYADGQNWDVTEYEIPVGATSVKVTLKYQSTSKEFVEFLRDENIDNPWDYFNAGEKVYNAWEQTGKSPPVDMATETINF